VLASLCTASVYLADMPRTCGALLLCAAPAAVVADRGAVAKLPPRRAASIQLAVVAAVAAAAVAIAYFSNAAPPETE